MALIHDGTVHTHLSAFNLIGSLFNIEKRHRSSGSATITLHTPLSSMPRFPRGLDWLLRHAIRMPQYLTVVAPSSDVIVRGLVQDCPISHTSPFLQVEVIYTLIPIPLWFSHGPLMCRHTSFGRRALRTFPVFDTVLPNLSPQVSLVA